ncbi:MAG: type II secretion system F family protein [Bacilli bacterium]|nr:type II secretion system F family protein [Bacilli bacterium]
MGEVNEYLSIYEQTTPVNNDIYITYTPDDRTESYDYRIIKDDEISSYVSSLNESTSILLSKTGIYKLEFIIYDIDGNTTFYQSGLYSIDKEKPVLEVETTSLTITKGQSLDDILISAYDNQDGDLTNTVTSNMSEIDLSTLGSKKLIYTVVDSAGNQTNSYININVVKDNTFSLLFINITILLFLGILLKLILSFVRALKYEKRIVNYSIEPIKNHNLSLSDKLIKIYLNILSNISRELSKSVFITRHSQKFDKYLHISNKEYQKSIDFISSKIVIAFIFVIVAVITNSIQGKLLQFYELVIPFFAGYLMPNVLYIYKYKSYIKKMENDLLQAITIMNNAFKSGRSIIQAIRLVTRELDGDMAEEFKKMSLELSLGLSVDTVFKRFEERLKMEEVTYLTASLSILNRTGGNITKVFSSIEKTLFNKKKLNLELNSLTGVSKIIVYVLIAVPLLFVLFVGIINPGYFSPLLDTTLGNIIIFIMLIIYVSYIYIVGKIMKVRM